MKERKELKIYGLHACMALGETRPEDIIRVYLHKTHMKVFKPLLKWCAEKKKAYHIISDEELEKVSDSVHHEGVCILAKEKPPLSFKEFICRLAKEKNVCLLYLDQVENPHNLGSIIRTAAHFGIFYIMGEKGKMPLLAPSAIRIARGGAEMIDLIWVDHPKETLKQLQTKGFTVIATSSHGGESLYDFSFPSRTVLAMGNESEGLSDAIFSLADEKVQIPGTDAVESLNVSVATALCLSEYRRKFRV